jgi:hypothetical protein
MSEYLIIMKRIGLISLCIITLFICCNSDNVKIATTTKSRQKAIRALKRINDSTDLLYVTLNAEYNDIDRLAMKRLSQFRLKSIVLENENYYFRQEAVSIIIDSIFLAQIALHDTNLQVSSAAMLNIKPIILVPYEHDNDYNIAVKFRRAIECVPNEYSFRERIIDSILPAIQLLHQDIVNIVGNIDTIRMKYLELSETYYKNGMEVMGKTGTKFGEAFLINIVFEKGYSISKSWESRFPVMTSDYSFLRANISSGDIIEEIIDILPKTCLIKISSNGNRGIRESAKNQLGKML